MKTLLKVLAAGAFYYVCTLIMWELIKRDPGNVGIKKADIMQYFLTWYVVAGSGLFVWMDILKMGWAHTAKWVKWTIVPILSLIMCTVVFLPSTMHIIRGGELKNILGCMLLALPILVVEFFVHWTFVIPRPKAWIVQV